MKEETAAANLSFLGPRRLLLFARELPCHHTPSICFCQRVHKGRKTLHLEENALKFYSCNVLALEAFQHRRRRQKRPILLQCSYKGSTVRRICQDTRNLNVIWTYAKAILFTFSQEEPPHQQWTKTPQSTTNNYYYWVILCTRKHMLPSLVATITSLKIFKQSLEALSFWNEVLLYQFTLPEIGNEAPPELKRTLSDNCALYIFIDEENTFNWTFK